MQSYRPIIGLEVHAELKTGTKLFCNSKNDADEVRPNVNICPVCMGYPGTLPVLNKAAVRHILRIGLALGGKLADYTEFDRKNYFYPDIPKGYQISQYKYPLVTGGALKGVAIERVHLEEDTARSTHLSGSVGEGGYSLIDFNRAGVPLMELVTKPVITSAAQAAAFGRELQLLLRTLGVGDANLEKGEMRVEANISVSKTDTFGTKVEIKNLNSFRAVERAITYEIKRQSELLENGGSVVQETRGWDETKEVTFSQRLKEASHDYRYFPDPDVPKFLRSEMADFSNEALQRTLPELPWEKRARYREQYGLKDEDVEMYVASERFGAYLENVAIALEGKQELVQLASNYITTDLAALYKSEAEVGKITPTAGTFAKLIRMTASGALSSRGAKDLLALMAQKGGDPETLAKELGLIQESDPAKLQQVIAQVIADNTAVVADYRAGKVAALQYLVGQGMKLSKGSGNPTVLREMFMKELG